MDNKRQGPSGNEGPGGAELWNSINWRDAERNVRRMRERIFKASQEGDLKKVRNLQRLMLSSRSNLLVSVRRVTQRSMGRRTPGVDGDVRLTPAGRGNLARTLANEPVRNARPVRRVYIPKANGKKRPLGIPTIKDRAQQARVKNALEPEWEARFDWRNYGFRPGRGCHDAIAAIHVTVSGRSKRPWILDADLSSAFDRIDHANLLQALAGFPAKEVIRRWLKAGVMEGGRFSPTEAGTPQGGVISPLLLNVALHGMGEAIGAKASAGRVSRKVQPVLIRYADDFVVLCESQESAELVKVKLAEWMAPKGLHFNEEKTKIVHISEGFDFLGFNIRRYPDGKTQTRPSRGAVARIKRRIKETIGTAGSLPVDAVIKNLSPIVRGWATYYRIGVSSRVFHALDHYTWQCLWRWATKRHLRKSVRWIRYQYWGQRHLHRKDQWVFGKEGAYLYKFGWTKIQRHIPVKGAASPDDPELREYWSNRRKKQGYPSSDRRSNIALAAKQKGLCPLCGLDLIAGATYEPDSVREWAAWFDASSRTVNRHHLLYRRNQGSDEGKNLVLIHADCHRQHHANDSKLGPRIPKRIAIESA